MHGKSLPSTKYLDRTSHKVCLIFCYPNDDHLQVIIFLKHSLRMVGSASPNYFHDAFLSTILINGYLLTRANIH